MTNKAKRKRRNIKMFIAAAAIFVVLVSILAYVSSQHAASREDSSQYFILSDPGAMGTSKNNGNMLIIKQFWFNITAVGGDAHEVTIFTDGMTDPTAYTFDEIKNGTSVYSGEISSSNGIPAYRTQGGYPVKVRIFCTEANGWITLVIPENATVSM